MARAKEVRRQLDDLGLRCYSNHTARESFDDEHLPRVVELNHLLGSRYVIMAHAGPQKDLDVATCLAAGADPLAFIRANAGRVKTYHLKDWSDDPGKGYRVLLGEEVGRWKELLELAETVGGVEHYLIEQEGSRFPAMETAKRCLDNFQSIRR